jgi:hypothetical protein
MTDINNVDKKEGDPLIVEDIFESEKKTETVEKALPEVLPEKKIEVVPETRPESGAEQKVEGETDRQKYAPVTPTPVQPAVPQVKDPEIVRIESILSEHLDELYLLMTPQQQLAFREKGEETANKIDKLLKDVKVRVKEILNLIKDWLKLLPGINKFFLEQEAKIKTDRLLNMREQKSKQK